MKHRAPVTLFFPPCTSTRGLSHAQDDEQFKDEKNLLINTLTQLEGPSGNGGGASSQSSASGGGGGEDGVAKGAVAARGAGGEASLPTRHHRKSSSSSSAPKPSAGVER